MVGGVVPGERREHTLTLCMTDMENSTPLLQEHPDEWPAILAAHRKVIEECFLSLGGRPVAAIGEEYFATFPSSFQAVSAAVMAMRALAAYPFPAHAEVRVRMGIHTGRPLATPEGLVGLDVHRAARIRAAAHGAQILISGEARVAYADADAQPVEFLDLGSHRMKGLVEPERLFQVVAPGLPRHFPPPVTLSRRPTGLPVPPHALIGRTSEVRELQALLARAEVRLVTITGPGGVGKTRLALEVAGVTATRFEGGVRFVSLESVRDPADVPAAVCSAFDIHGADVRALAREMEDRPVLLVLDNFEHVSEAAGLVAEVLALCPRLTVLVTSREPLWIRGERGFPLEPLPVPAAAAGAAGVMASPAVQLFVARAADVRPGFAVTDDTATAIGTICQRLDGLPLALELVAARARLLSPERILERLVANYDLASDGPRDVQARHRSLDAAISWSYDLLPPDQREILRDVCIFRGAFTTEMAVAVLGDQYDSSGIGDRLDALSMRNLLRASDGPNGEPLFSMLSTIREFAMERLIESDRYEEIAERHLDWFCNWANALDRQGDQTTMVVQQAAHWSDLREALAFAMTTPERARTGLSLAVAMGSLYWQRAPREGWAQYKRLLAFAADASPTLRSRALRWVSLMGGAFRPPEEVVATAEECAELARSLTNRPVVKILALNILGQSLVPVGQHDRAVATCREAVDMARALGEPRLLGLTNGPYGQALLASGDIDGARAAWEECIEHLSRVNEILSLPSALCWLAGLELQAGNLDAAEHAASRAVSIVLRTGDAVRLSEAYAHLARIGLARRDASTARQFLRESLACARMPSDLNSSEAQGAAWALTATATFLAAHGNLDGAIRLILCSRHADAMSRRIAERPELEAIVQQARKTLTPGALGTAISSGTSMNTSDGLQFALLTLEAIHV